MTEETKTEVPTSGNPLLDSVKAERAALEKSTMAAKEQADRLEKLRAEQLLSGTAGGNIPVVAKEETPGEYAKRMLRGGK